MQGEKRTPGRARRWEEATAGFEPAMEVLQTSALTTWLRRQTRLFYAIFDAIVKEKCAFGLNGRGCIMRGSR